MDELDEAERRAIEMVEFFQAECRKNCEPYLTIIGHIRSLRPRLFLMDGQTIVPFLPAPTASGGAKP